MRKLLGFSGMLILSLMLLLAASCGKEEPQKVDARQAQANNAKAQIADLQNSANALSAQIDQAKGDVTRINGRLAEMQTALDTIKKKSADLQGSLDTLMKTRQGEAPEGGWPWYVKLFLILVVLVLVFLVYKVVTRDGGEGDEENSDESFVEENDLGSVRYPGTKPDTTKKD